MNVTNEIFYDLKSYSKEEQAEFRKDLRDITIDACGGKENEETVETWRRIYKNELENLDVFSHMVICRQEGGSAISFALFRDLLTNGKKVSYVQLSMTIREYQRSGVALQGWLGIGNKDYFHHYSGGYIVVKTPNPVVYLGFRNAALHAGKMYNHKIKMYPKILSSELLEDVRDDVMCDIKKISEELDADVELDSARFVLRRAFSKYQALFSTYNFPCDDQVVAGYFKNYLSYEEKDAMLLVVGVD